MEEKLFRKCVGCGELKSRENMIKLTKNHLTGEIVLNPNSKTFGRSAYLCYNQSCIEQALKKNKINKVLRTKNTCENLKGLLDGQFKS